MVVRVEADDLVDRGLDAVGDAEEVMFLGRDVARAFELALDERAPVLPVGAAGHVEEHDRRRLRLAGLEEGEQLEGLVEGAEAAGEQHERVGLLDELELAGEEVAEVDELRIVGDELAGGRLERQADAHAERVVGAGALDPGLHDPGPGAGDHHPVARGHRRGEPAGLVVERVVGLGAGGAEDRDLRAPR